MLGLAGTLCLLIALTGPPHGGRDLAQFGVDAAALFGIALLTGLGPIIARIRRRPVSSLVLGLHATFAIMGLVVLAVYL